MRYIDSKTANCTNCYKCLRNCQVKAITYSNHKVSIDESLCILCGDCINICPQNAQVAVDNTTELEELLNSNTNIIASVAPSFITDFNVSGFEDFRDKLISLGFSDAFETIEGAKLVDDEYEKILNRSNDLLISTCCPVVINYVTKYYPNLMHYLAPVVSPMVAYAKLVHERFPNSKVVFIGPCLAKKDEATWEDNIVDLVVTFQEINNLFEKNKILFPEQTTIKTEQNKKTNIRLYPTTGGIIGSFKHKEGLHYFAKDGLKDIKNFLDELSNGNYSNTFVELSACSGSCISGPCKVHKKDYLSSMLKLNEYINTHSKIESLSCPSSINLSREFNQMISKTMIPSEYEIKQILKKIGKYKKEDELNCGACGYNSCREKAIAVYNGRAELEMCIPFMKEKAESLSVEIIDNSPNGIICFNSNLELQNINKKAYEYLGIDENLKMQDFAIEDYIDLIDFQLAITNISPKTQQKKIVTKKTNKTLNISIVYVSSLDFIFGVLLDLTKEEQREEFLHEVRLNTINVTNSVIDKQMRSVQEIASLLGETVAETKVALTKLKKVMEDEKE